MKSAKHILQSGLTMALLILMIWAISAAAQARPAIVTTGDLRQIVVYSDPANNPTAQTVIPGLPSDAYPHGVSFFSSTGALVGDHQKSRVFVVRTSPAALVATIDTAAAGYDGSGTVAVTPDRTAALAMGGNNTATFPNGNKLFKIQAPFNASSPITSITLPGYLGNFQTEGIVFDNNGRAFVRHSTGISVLDAPYTSIAFTIPITTGTFAAVAVTPDGNTLFSSGSGGGGGVFGGGNSELRIYHAPFSASSVADILPTVIAGLDGIAVTPDGSRLLYVSNNVQHVGGAIFAPFNASSTKQPFSLPSGSGTFEDVGISPDGQLAILAGGGGSEPPILVKAPFDGTAAASFIPVNGANQGRGGGAARFAPLNSPTAANRPPFDFDGDGKADLSVFRPASGAWYLNQSQAGFVGIGFGISTDRIVPADYDGDGKTDVAVFRSGVWYLLRSQAGFTNIQFGASDDIPAPADFDGDGKADLAVFRPSSGVWYLQQSTAGFAGVQFGQSGDQPVAADYDGDGKSDLAVFRGGIWYVLRSQLGLFGIQFGTSEDKASPADYDGDGKTDVAVFRPSNGTWYLQRSSQGFTSVQFGANGDVPSAADYDGDGRADVAVFRNGTWYLNRTTAGFVGIGFGAAGDKPVPSAFVP